jgi:hypothetical protein
MSFLMTLRGFLRIRVLLWSSIGSWTEKMKMLTGTILERPLNQMPVIPPKLVRRTETVAEESACAEPGVRS